MSSKTERRAAVKFIRVSSQLEAARHFHPKRSFFGPGGGGEHASHEYIADSDAVGGACVVVGLNAHCSESDDAWQRSRAIDAPPVARTRLT